MSHLQTIKQRAPILFSALIATLTLLAVLVGGIVVQCCALLFGKTGAVELFFSSYYANLFLQEGIVLLAVLFLCVQSGNKLVLSRKGSGLRKSALVALYPLCVILYLLIAMFADALFNQLSVKPVWEIGCFIAAMFCIGFAEELAFRGIIAETLLRHFGTSAKGIWQATIVSGLLFGSSHLINIFAAEPLGVLVQTAVAVALGMLFSAIYYRTGNLWIVVLVHMCLNMATLLQGGVFGAANLQEVISGFSVLNLVPVLTYGLPVLYLLRKAKQHEIRAWFADGEQHADGLDN